MSDVAIRVYSVSKRYEIGEKRGYKTLRESLASAVRNPFRRNGQNGHPADARTFWALKNVTFDVHRGEIIGVIGRNGAGKSTLLKILSRITDPTEGEIDIEGRVGSLLEVGTGFHLELTGRENIFLNGAILGMKRAEIAARFDEIVDFAGTEKFLDTPVKYYSSGMYTRLAFAIAAHLEPEILIVDEVLAVGDAEFQKKCLGKMGDVARSGRTVLFVSHNMQAVTRLCKRVIFLQSGEIVRDGDAYEATSEYLKCTHSTSASREWNLHEAPGDNVVRLRAVRARTADGGVSGAFDIRQPIAIDVVFDVLESGHVLTPNLHFFDEDGIYLFISHDADSNWRSRPRPPGRYVSTAWIPRNFLAEGTLTVGAAITTLSNANVRLYEREAISFQIIDSVDGDTARGDYMGHLPGVVRPLLAWETSHELLPVEQEQVTR
jgi:lipopolysaccharide transport system ATP-binding protein